MGLVFVTHAAWVLVSDPPDALMRRAEYGGIGWLLAVAGLVGVVAWQLIGAAAALLFQALHAGYPTSIPAVPSAVYLAATLFVASALAVTFISLMPGRIRHVLFEVAAFTLLFGLLIPFLASST